MSAVPPSLPLLADIALHGVAFCAGYYGTKWLLCEPPDFSIIKSAFKKSAIKRSSVPSALSCHECEANVAVPKEGLEP